MRSWSLRAYSSAFGQFSLTAQLFSWVCGRPLRVTCLIQEFNTMTRPERERVILYPKFNAPITTPPRLYVSNIYGYIKERAIILWLSKVIQGYGLRWFCFSSLCNWSRKLYSKFNAPITTPPRLYVSNIYGYIKERAIILWLSKVIQGYGLRWFCFSSLCNWSRKLAPTSQPIRCKTKIKHDDLVTRVFPRFKQFGCFHFEFSMAPCDISFLLIGCCDNSGFGFTPFNRKAL